MTFASSSSLKEIMDRNIEVYSLYEKLFAFPESQQFFRKLELYLVVAVKPYRKIVLGFKNFLSVCFARVAEVKLIPINCVAFNFHANSDLLASCASSVNETFVFAFELFH